MILTKAEYLAAELLHADKLPNDALLDATIEVSSDNEHQHKCSSCGHIWTHVGLLSQRFPKPDYPGQKLSEMETRMHTCVVCGEQQWRKYVAVDADGTHTADELRLQGEDMDAAAETDR